MDNIESISENGLGCYLSQYDEIETREYKLGTCLLLLSVACGSTMLNGARWVYNLKT